MFHTAKCVSVPIVDSKPKETIIILWIEKCSSKLPIMKSYLIYTYFFPFHSFQYGEYTGNSTSAWCNTIKQIAKASIMTVISRSVLPAISACGAKQELGREALQWKYQKLLTKRVARISVRGCRV